MIKHHRWLTVIIYFIFSLVAPFFLPSHWPVYLRSFLASALVFIAVIYLNEAKLKADWQTLKQQTSLPRLFLQQFGLLILNNLLTNLVILLLSQYIPSDQIAQNQSLIQDLVGQTPIAYIIFTVAIYAPMVEELVFREAIMGGVKPQNRKAKWLSICLSMGIFILLHSYQVWDFLIYLPLTSVITWLYWRYQQNIWAAISFHLLNNGLSILSMILLQSLDTFPS